MLHRRSSEYVSRRYSAALRQRLRVSSISSPPGRVGACALSTAVWRARQAIVHRRRRAVQGQLAKIARNFLLATVIESMGEAFALIANQDWTRPVPECSHEPSFNAPAYKNYGRMIVEQTFEPATFVLRLGLKDVELALEAGGDNQVPMLMASLIREQHLGALACGFGEKDWASLAQYIAQRAGL